MALKSESGRPFTDRVQNLAGSAIFAHSSERQVIITKYFLGGEMECCVGEDTSWCSK
jgi:hypothetical protein